MMNWRMKDKRRTLVAMMTMLAVALEGLDLFVLGYSRMWVGREASSRYSLTMVSMSVSAPDEFSELSEVSVP